MNQEFDVSIVMCTYNRGKMLRGALESLATQHAGDVRFEVVVVDNNSTDDTKRVVGHFVASYPNWSYVFEPQQGLSYARNSGVAHARAPIVAFTDDDVRAAPDWVAQVKHSLDDHPEVDFVGGRVYPRWAGRPPAWLTKRHWAPLAIVDHGDESFYVDAARPLCMVGANLSVRKRVLVEAGGFSPSFQRVKDVIGSTEDHEFQLRLWRDGRRGLYVPSAIVHAEVQSDRLRKAYHRRWHAGHGRFCAMMGTETITEDMPELFGIPACFLRSVSGHGFAWLMAVTLRREDAALVHENNIRFLLNYARTHRELTPTLKRRSVPMQTLRGLGVLLRRKFAVVSRQRT